MYTVTIRRPVPMVYVTYFFDSLTGWVTYEPTNNYHPIYIFVAVSFFFFFHSFAVINFRTSCLRNESLRVKILFVYFYDEIFRTDSGIVTQGDKYT